MAITPLITAGLPADDEVLDISADAVLVATKLAVGESVKVYVYGSAGDVEPVINEEKAVVLTKRNNTARLAGPCIYHVYKSETSVSLGVGYYV